MTELLIRLFVRNRDNPEVPCARLSYGLLTGYTGIFVNLFLFAVKLTAGILSGSIAMAADAVNNLSDSGSSLVTVLGFQISSRPPDNEHPFGHGRFEYVAAVIIAVIIISVGLDFLKESVTRIFSPAPVKAGTVILIIFGCTILFKLWLFVFYRKIGKKIHSKVLEAAAFDSLSDMLGTGVVLVAVFLGRYTSLPVDGIAGTLVAGLVIYGGIGVLKETISPLIGECPDRKIVDDLREKLLQCEGIKGVHDIILHNYGPGQFHATAHAEISNEVDVASAHDIIESAEVEVARTLPVRLVLHCDPYNTEDPVVKLWRTRMEETSSSLDPKFKVYDFHFEDAENKGETGHVLHFHLLIPRNYLLSYEEIRKILTDRMRKYDPEIVLEINFFHAFV